MTPEEIRKQMMGSAGVTEESPRPSSVDCTEAKACAGENTLFAARKGKTFGPHTLAELDGFISEGHLGPEDYCWQKGWKEWRTIGSVLSAGLPPEK
jgi:hypothetical protein